MNTNKINNSISRGDTEDAIREIKALLDVMIARINHLENRTIPRHPLDHDGDGRLGGSLPKAQRKPKS